MKEQIKYLLSANPILPGTLEKHYNVCGKAGCRCKDKSNPRKHGPYYRLSYSIKGKNSSVFVKKEDAKAVKEMTENYRNSRSNIQELSLEMLESYREKGVKGMLAKYSKLTERENRKKVSVKPESAILRNMRISRGEWKSKALARQATLNENRVKIRDITGSRSNWKDKALDAQKNIKELQKELEDTQKKLIKTESTGNRKKNSTQ